MNNLRVHGTKVLRRRSDVVSQNDYHKYECDLQRDFQYICGYCGKHEMITHKGMEPDHFVPDRIDPSRKTDYTNLVYSCFTCNRKKSGKWPTEDKDLYNNGIEGFVDPASDAYDQHLKRDADGAIVFCSDVGEYMHKKAFAFNIRPIKEVWKASQLYEKKIQLHKLIQSASDEDKVKYIEIDMELTQLHEYLFACKE